MKDLDYQARMEVKIKQIEKLNYEFGQMKLPMKMLSQTALKLPELLHHVERTLPI